MPTNENLSPCTSDEDIRSEEVQDIVDRMPTQWAMWTALVTGVLILAVVALGFVIKYPDVVAGQITITTEKAPVRLVSHTAGRLHLLYPNKTKLKGGETLGYIESGVNYDDFLWLNGLLDTLKLSSSYPLPERTLVLGDMATAYNSFAQAKWQWDRTRTSPLYQTMCASLEEQIRADERVVETLLQETDLKKEMMESAGYFLTQDSILASIQGISRESFHGRRDDWLSRKDAWMSTRSNRLVKEAEIAKNKLEIARIRAEEEENLQKTYTAYVVAYNELMNVVRLWKERYLAVAPIGGQLEYLGFWRENVFVESMTELFSIIPERNRTLGEVQLSMVGAGKVETGQEANVKLLDFPFDEFGKLKGKVISVSRVTQKLQSKEGTTEAYLAVIDFPDGTRTNFGRALELNPEAKGEVEIVTKPKRLIHRLFDNLKAKSEK